MPDQPSTTVRKTPGNDGVVKRSIKTGGQKLALAVLFPLALVLLIELVLKAAGYHHQIREKVLLKPSMISGYIGTLEFLIKTTWAPPGYTWVSQPNTEYTDRYGFRLPEISMTKPPDKIRVAFLGGSTTQGGFRPYPTRAIRLLNLAIGSNRYEVLNAACSSYSTHQSLIALKRWVLPRQPDIVFVYHGWNDVLVADDGYADKSKDRLVDAEGKPRLTMPDYVKKMRITELMGQAAEAFGPPWPEQRVPMNDFEANLDAMAAACQSNRVRMIIMTRPGQAESRMAALPMKAGSAEAAFARRTYNTDNSVRLYQDQWKDIVAAQRAVAERHEHVSLFEGHSVVSNLIEQASAGYYGPNVPIFHDDHVHLYDFADELLAQQVAMAIAPEHAAAVSNFITGAAYLGSIAEELLREGAPREAAWCLRKAIAQHHGSDRALVLELKLNQAEQQFEFFDLFRSARWGGSDHDFNSKLDKLKRCLAMKPTDFGVMAQIYRVCAYMGHAEEAAAAMAPFIPQTMTEQIVFLEGMMESHRAGGRVAAAKKTAAQILKLDPTHPLALSYTQQSMRSSHEK